ncbi:hypothetical protein ACLBKU_08825 [Erythrobacter sp. NE805]|uniref:hypothetical protein n=1 Tax=Erythrobacter sp. NE805 TaxID=3389875 RepID=UPI00396B09A4
MIGRVVDRDEPFTGFSARAFQGSWEELKAEAEDRCGFALSDAVVRNAVRTLADCGLVRVSDDSFAGEFVKTYPNKFRQFLEAARAENTAAVEGGDIVGLVQRPSDYPNAHALAEHPVVEDYAELGDEWLKRALSGLRRQVEQAGSLEEFLSLSDSTNAPASDRIVTFSHNQAAEFEAETTAVIDAVEALNGVGEDPRLRDLILGQLRAGREFVRAGCVKLYLIQYTLIDTLQFLAKRYEKEAIGALASALATALLKHIGLDS